MCPVIITAFDLTDVETLEHTKQVTPDPVTPCVSETHDTTWKGSKPQSLGWTSTADRPQLALISYCHHIGNLNVVQGPPLFTFTLVPNNFLASPP